MIDPYLQRIIYETRFTQTYTVKHAASALDRRLRGGSHLSCSDSQCAQDCLDDLIYKN